MDHVKTFGIQKTKIESGFFRQRKELAKIEAERIEKLKLKTIELKRTNEKSLLYTMEEVIYEEVEDEEEEKRKKEDVVTDDEIEEEIDQFKNNGNKEEVSEASDIPEEMSEEQDDEIPEAIEFEDDSGKIHNASN